MDIILSQKLFRVLFVQRNGKKEEKNDTSNNNKIDLCVSFILISNSFLFGGEHEICEMHWVNGCMHAY